jgi:hypothetical protein
MKKALTILIVILLIIVNQGFAQVQSQHILFASNSSALEKKTLELLNVWMEQHSAEKDMLFRVQGFADSRNSDDYNKELAAKRSHTIAEHLRKNGFRNIFEQSFGEGNPICNEDTPECLALNRRVEIWTNGKDDVLSLADYFGRKPAQVFYINPKIENIIQGNEGTKVVIPAFAFKLNDKTVHDTVRIELTEFYNKGEMLLNGLTTKAYEGLIESAGTVHIAAFDAQAQLTLQTGKVIGLAFNNRTVEDGMITFYGGNQTFMNASCKVPSEGIQRSTANYLALNTNTNSLSSTNSAQGGIEWKSGVEHYDYIFRDLQLYNNPDIRDDAHGAAKNYIDAHPKYIQVASLSAIDRQPKSNFTENSFKVLNNDYKLLYERMNCFFMRVDGSVKTTSSNATNYSSTADFVDQIKNADPSQPDANDDILTISTKLGWINCDRWLKSGLDLTNVSVSSPEPNTFYYLVFDNIQSIMPGYFNCHDNTVIFGNVPVGYKAKLIAIKASQEQYGLGMKEIVCGKESQTISTEDMTREDIESKLKGDQWKIG